MNKTAKELKAEVKEIAEDYTRTKLVRAVAESIADREDEIENYISEVLQHGCASGIVSELIYYYDTNKFFDDHYNDIMSLRDDYSNEMGEDVNPPKDHDLKNWFAWFAYEEITRQIADSINIEV